MTLGKGKENLPFSSLALPLDVRDIPKLAIGDPRDGSLWVCDFESENPSFERMELPNQDRFKHWSHVGYKERPQLQALRLFEAVDRSSMRVEFEFVLVGEKNAYAFNLFDNSLEVLTGTLREKHAPRKVKKRTVARYNDEDITHPKIEVRDAAGVLLFSHQYAPRTLHKRWIATRIYAQSLCRSPLLQVIRFASVAGSTRNSLVVDGKHAWLLTFHLMFAVALAFLALRRLRALGQGAVRQAFWTTLILSGGLLVYVFYRMIESRRAYRPGKILSPEESRPLLIKSA